MIDLGISKINVGRYLKANKNNNAYDGIRYIAPKILKKYIWKYKDISI